MGLIQIPRQNPHLHELITWLHQPFERAKGDRALAWASLIPQERAVIAEEIAHCVRDRRYFLENFYVIKPENMLPKTFYPFWDHQEIVYEAITIEWDENGFAKVIVVKPRQAGLSEFSVALMFHATIFTPNSFTMTVAQDGDTSEQLYRKATFAYENLPWWMQPEVKYKERGSYMEFMGASEKEGTINPGLASAFQMTHSQKNTGIAIGRTLSNAHFTEVSRWANTK